MCAFTVLLLFGTILIYVEKIPATKGRISMKPGKPWIKKILLTAGIIAIIGVGVSWAAGMNKSDYKQAFEHGKQNAEPYFYKGGGKDLAGPAGRHERGMRGGEHHGGGDAAAAVGGTILAGGLLYWVIQRRKKTGAMSAAQTAPVIPSTSDFLDQWEKNQTNKKETN